MYNVQQKTQSKIARQARIGFTILGIATIFVTCFLMTQAIMTAVYGIELSASYHQVYNVTQQAADITQGYSIDAYVQDIKEQVCPTLIDNAQYLECLNF